MNKAQLAAILCVFSAAAAGSTSCSISDTLPEDGGGSGAGGPSGPSPTKVCEDQCVPLHEGGEADYRILRECMLCGACADACVDSDDGACVNGAVENPAMCSAMAGGDCAACVASPCVLSQSADTTFLGLCAPFASVCSMNTPCVQLIGCIDDCVLASAGMGGNVGGN
jgi:hypothetical protein